MVQRTGVDDRIGILVAAQHHHKITYHGCLLLLIKFYYILVRELLHTEVYTTEDGLVVMGDKAASAAQSEETLNYARQLLSAQSADVSSEQ